MRKAEQVKARLAGWLAPRGLAFNEDKTRIVHLDDGCDFLGFTVRRFYGKLLIKPSKAAMRRIRERLAAEMRALRGANARGDRQAQPDHPGLGGLLPGRGVQQGVRRAGQPHVAATYKWAKHTPPEQAEALDHDRYFGRFNTSRQDQWVFGDRDSGAYLARFAWTKIVRHRWSRRGVTRRPRPGRLLGHRRRRRNTPPLDRAPCACCRRSTAAARSAGTCSCTPTGSHKAPEEWEQWLARHPQGDHAATHHRRARRHPDDTASVSYTPTATAGPPARGNPALLRLRRPQGLLEPDAVKAARPVLRGRRRSNAPHLPDNTRAPITPCVTPSCRHASCARATQSASSRRCGPCSPSTNSCAPMVEAAESRPGTDPDRCGFTIAFQSARDLVIHAEGVIEQAIGAIGRRVLAGLLPPDARVSTRKVKSPISRYAERKMDGRPGDSQNVTSMTIMALAPPPPEPPLPAATIPQYAGPGRTSNRMNRVLDLLQAEPGRQWRAREIAGLLGDVTLVATYRQLARWTEKGLIKRVRTGRYTAASPTPSARLHPPTKR